MALNFQSNSRVSAAAAAARVSPIRSPSTAVIATIVLNGSGASAMILRTSSSVKQRGSSFTPSRGKVRSAKRKSPHAYFQDFAVLRSEESVSNTFSTVLRERPPVARYATNPCTAFVLISGKNRLPNFGMMCARRCDSVALTALPFKLTATFCRPRDDKLRKRHTDRWRQLLGSLVHLVEVRLKLSPGCAFRLFIYQPVPALLPHR